MFRSTLVETATNNSQKIPVALVDTDDDKRTFVYNEDGLQSQFFPSPNGHQHALASASIGREDIPQSVQDSNQAVDNRSVFGGSQAASASMSANMHRIVEDVERLVESDTYENAPIEPNRLSPFRAGNCVPSTPGDLFQRSSGATPYDPTLSARNTPVAPPDIGAAAARDAGMHPGQSYAPRPAFPGIPSIWTTDFSPQVADTGISRTPPGLSQQSGRGSVPSPSHQYSSDHYNALGQSQLSKSSQYPFSGASWGRDASHGIHPSLDGANQLMSSDLANASWANNAFIASAIPSAIDYPGSGFGGTRRSGTQLGAIGQTPPCGQGG